MAKRRRRRRALVDFNAQRFPTALVVLLTLITLGLYQPIWFLQRRAFLDSLGTPEKIGSLPIFALVAQVLNLVLAFSSGGRNDGPGGLVSLVGGVLILVMSFRAKGMLRQYSARRDRLVSSSSAGTFFFQTMYLQYKINEMADRFAEAPEADTSAFD